MKIRQDWEPRFREKVDQRGPDECWLWLASNNGKGYGRYRIDGQNYVADRDRKGRTPNFKGTANPAAKLKPQDVRLIRRLYPLHSQREIAEMYGVARPTISYIIQGRSWSHV